jgi:hypothetical protein
MWRYGIIALAFASKGVLVERESSMRRNIAYTIPAFLYSQFPDSYNS